MSTRLLRGRPARVTPAITISVLLLLAAAALVWWAVAALNNGQSAPADVLPGLSAVEGVQWADPVVLIIAGALVGIGLVLIIMAVSPGASRYAPHGTSSSGVAQQTEIALLNSALANIAAAEADTVDGVAGVRAIADARHVSLAVSTPLRDTAQLRSEVAESVRRRLDGISLAQKPKVTVRVRSDAS